MEFVASGSRLRLYIAKETCLVTFLLSGQSNQISTSSLFEVTCNLLSGFNAVGIDCPRGSRPDPARPGSSIGGDAFGDKALNFTREMCLQHEVQVEVESMDKVC